jgi:hypothetical protein
MYNQKFPKVDENPKLILLVQNKTQNKTCMVKMKQKIAKYPWQKW